MAGKGGGAWKVAYADFVTAMMAFFLVMWITSQSKDVREAIAKHFNDPFPKFAPPWMAQGMMPVEHVSGEGVAGRKKHGKPAASDGQTAKNEQTEGDPARKPNLLNLHGGQRSFVGAVVLFDENSADLSDAAKQQLKRLMPAILGKPQKIEIRGHAPRRPAAASSPYQDPWQLSYARCLATMRFLEHEGVPTERMRLSQAGAHEPRTLRLEPEQQTLNSRVDVFMLSEFAQDLVGTPEERAKRFEEQSPQPSSEKTGPAQTPTSHSQRTTDASAAETARVSSHVWEGEAPVEPPKDASPATFTGGSAGRSGESGTRTSEFQWDAPAVADRGPF